MVESGAEPDHHVPAVLGPTKQLPVVPRAVNGCPWPS